MLICCPHLSDQWCQVKARPATPTANRSPPPTLRMARLRSAYPNPPRTVPATVNQNESVSLFRVSPMYPLYQAARPTSSQVTRGRLEACGVISEVREAAITAVTESAPDAAGLVVVIYVKSAALRACATDRAAALLGLEHPVVVGQGDSVGLAQP